ncbi:MAG: MutH/Sau3AI family endonuclease [Candidatus Cloacimonetes bacterium]|nr:MutH/Sau3AI family endonuclease [Candidatus Cloacimonadota bacterium]
MADYAEEFGITTYKDGKQNKGWKGLVIERLAGLSNSNLKAPNGLCYEIKSTAFELKAGTWVPKETCAITMINPSELEQHSFYESHCWEKLKSLIFCAVSWNGRHNLESRLLKVQSFDFNDSSSLIQQIKEDYDLIRNKLITQGYGALTGRDGIYLQARTKGPGHGSTSRAFYAKKSLVAHIIGDIEV